VKITEIDFKNGLKYQDDKGNVWTIDGGGLFRMTDSNLNFNKKYRQDIEEFYTILGIASCEFEKI
jgi:hypothetical protein